MPMYNLIKTARVPPALDIDTSASGRNHQTMDRMTSLSIEGDNVSMTVVIQPARKQTMRLSFVETYPMETFTTTHRFQSEESVESQKGCTLYSQESLASGSNMSYDHIESETLEGLNTHQSHQINSNISLSNCYTHRDVQTTSWNMSPRNSSESRVDPYLCTNIIPPTPTNPSNLSIMEIRDNERFSAIPDHNLTHNDDIGCNDCNASTAVQKTHDTPLDHVGFKVDSITGCMTPDSTSAELIDCFPVPPPTRALARLPIRTSLEQSDQDAEDDCFSDWLQQIQARFVSRQTSLGKKQAMLEFKHSILRSHNTPSPNQELSLGLQPGPVKLPSFDFETYYGVTNDMRHSDFPQLENQEPSMRPASFCRISTAEGEIIDVCQEAEFTAEEEMKERKQLIKSAKLEEAQLCIVKDERGRKILFKDVIRHRQTIVIFLRFFWCAKCQDYVRSISKFFEPGTPARKNLDDTNSTVVFIGTGSWQMISSYRALLGCSFDFFTDCTTTSRLFRKMGLNRIMLGGSSDPATLHKTLTIWQTMIQSAKSIPKLPLHYPGSFTQLGGEFCFQNLAADYSAPSTPKTPKLSLQQNIVKKFSLKSPNRSNLTVAPRMEELPSDPFRRSLFIEAPVGTVAPKNSSAVRCIYANRMKSSSSHGNFYTLFQSAGVEYVN
ncbi:hypothetical protein PCASD_05434 [Puccinia coronata f. sp. avenae]|uniref:Uncharacterized protein n=1 Tax=Puccinia coronata f. sp. avenae TaxID=200324 RepID=A0A2N5UV65_9BASI|nr:hypothetical protein PCASD_05434 [Puccinia coronata f. sp. avenae]